MGGKPNDSDPGTSTMHGCLVTPLPDELDTETLATIRQELLVKAQRLAVKGVVLDMSAVRAVDSYTVHHLAGTVRMVRLMGVETVFAGIQPGVASTIVDLDIDTRDFRTCSGMEDGIDHLVAAPAATEDAGDDEYDEPDTASGEPESDALS